MGQPSWPPERESRYGSLRETVSRIGDVVAPPLGSDEEYETDEEYEYYEEEEEIVTDEEEMPTLGYLCYITPLMGKDKNIIYC